jgi:hypothetical protein
MCLQIVHELDDEERRNLAAGVGWKSVRIYGKVPYLLGKPYQFNKWFKAKRTTVVCNSNRSYTSGFHTYTSGFHTYTSGFHIFLKRIDAINYGYGSGTLVKVNFGKIRGIGKQNYSDRGHTVLADEMLMIRKR